MATGTELQAHAHARTRKLGFRSDIHGLRAIAVGLVLLYHSGVSVLSGGYVGVDAFFVISGFLITTHLLESLARDSRINFGAFYAKRARRILPASLFVAAVTVLAALVWVPPLQLRAVFRDAIATALYVPNMLFASNGTDYLADTTPSVFQHYWSLGVEEQFYIFWPLLIWVGYLLARRSERRLLWVVATLVVASFALCIIVTQVSQPWAFFSLPTRAWELGVGALVAFLIRAQPSWLKAQWAGMLAWVGVFGLFGSAFVFSSATLFPGFNAAFPVLATALIIIGGHQRPQAALTRALSVRPMQSLGSISYSLYLVHWPLLVIPQAVAGEAHPLPLWLTLTLGALSIPIAFLVYRYVEQPFLKTPVLTRARPRRSLVAALVGSAAVVALAAGSMMISNRIPLDSGQTVQPAALTAMPSGTGHVPVNLEPALRNAGGSVSILYDNGCHQDSASTDSSGCQFGDNSDAPLVFLFGDSHAEHWFPALLPLAEAGQIRLDTNTKSSCPSVSLTRELHGVDYAACSQWRQSVIDRIGTSEPATVILSNYGKPDIDAAAFEREWEAGLTATIDAMPAGTRTVILSDTPDAGGSIPVCLSSRLEQANLCSVERDAALHNAPRDAEQNAVAATGAARVDLTDYLCGETSCPAVIGNLLVYRDSHHMTVEFSEALSPVLAQALQLG